MDDSSRRAQKRYSRIQFSLITLLIMSGIDHCPGSFVENVTTTDMRHHGDTDPVIFHLGRDPGEKFPLGKNSQDYKRALASISNIVKSRQLIRNTVSQNNKIDLL